MANRHQFTRKTPLHSPGGRESRYPTDHIVGSGRHPSRLYRNRISIHEQLLLRHRYLIIGILFNVPGNALIGGGGGIGLIAGMSKLYPFPKYLLLICLAITPGPILFLLRAAQV